MKKYRQLIMGIIIGALLTGTVSFATSYIANIAGFKVFVNGKEFVSDPPALEVEGRTYLPLRAIGDALGVPVKWNEELGQAEVNGPAEKAVMTLGAGQYIVGEDIPPGKYNLKAVKDIGNFFFYKKDAKYSEIYNGPVPEISLMIGITTVSGFAETYENLRTENGDKIEVNGAVKIEFTKIN